MFIVQAKEKVTISGNSLDQDFIRFLPSAYGCLPSELVLHYIVPGSRAASILTTPFNGKVEIEGGILKKYINTAAEGAEPVWEFVEEAHAQPLVSSWPYEEINGELVFKGIELVK